MSDKNKGSDSVNNPKPFEKGFGVQTVHDKPRPSGSGNNNGGKKK